MPNPTSTLGPGAVLETGTATHYVDWGAILAGVFISIAISSMFFAFGSAIGLSMTSFTSPDNAPGLGVVIAAGLWLLWVQISSFLGGAYVAGRLRRRIGDATEHEVEMRDGAHGLILWAVNIVIGTALAGFIALAGVSGVASGVGAAAGAAADSGVMDYYAERLMRSDAGATATAPGGDAAAVAPAPDAAAPATPVAPATATAPTSRASDPQSTAQVGRILTRNVAARTFDAGDQSYLVREISARTGLSEADAQKRLDEMVATLKSNAETARRYAVLLAFLTAASLLVSAVAAWWAAQTGGEHRDQGLDHSHLARWR